MKLPSDLLRIFVYGSLKRGYAYHDDYCHGALSIEPASVRGTLFEHPSGFPVVEIDRHYVLAGGSSDPSADMAIQKSFELEAALAEMQALEAIRPPGHSKLVCGELMTFDDPDVRLPALDGLEGFHPGRLTLYRRVLAPVHSSFGLPLPAWMYVLGLSREKLKLLPSSSWTPASAGPG